VLDLKKRYDLPNPDDKYDDIPEIWEGHNIADFVDTDILQKLEELEKEEAMLEEAGVYESEEENMTEEQKEIMNKAHLIRKEKAVIRHQHRLNKHRNRTPISDRVIRKKQGIKRARSQSVGASESAMDTDAKFQTKKRATSRDVSGLRDASQIKTVKALKKRSQIKMNQFGRAGEADRHISAKLPKHLFSGKRGAGKTQRR
jgi:nucleolar GTP-binding protein